MMKKEVMRVFINIVFCAGCVILLSWVGGGTMPQPIKGILTAILVLLTAYWAYWTVRSAAYLTSDKK